MYTCNSDESPIVFRLQETIEKQAESHLWSLSTLLCVQPPTGKVWSSESLALPRALQHLAAQGEKTWVGH